MTNGLTTPKATAWPPGPPPRAAREAPPQSDAFAGMLDAQQARTASAEGQKKSPEAPDDAAAPVAQVETPADAPAEDKDEKVTAAAAAVVVAPVAAPVVVATATPDAPAVAAPVAQAAPVEAPVPVAAVPTTPQAPQTPVVPQAAPVPTTPAASDPVLAAVPEATTAPATTEAPATPAPVKDNAPQPATPSANASPKALDTPSRTTADPGQQQGQPKDGLPANASAVAQQVARVANPEARAARPEQAQAPVQAPAPVATPASAPAAANAARADLPQATPVPLSRAADAVENVLRLASARGVTHARIALRPAELGSVDVHLRSTAEGLVARVVAHSPEAVQHLQQAAGDLRRSLEEQGLTLLNLDIGQSGERSAGRSGSDGGELASGGGAASDAGLVTAEDETPVENSTLQLPNGVLVDVLA